MARGLPPPPSSCDRGAAATPVHVQIASWLRAAIARGRPAPGRPLPGERDLAERLGVSRMTLRQALAELESSGDLVRVAGRAGGAFVAEPRVEVDLTHLAGLTDQVRRAGPPRRRPRARRASRRARARRRRSPRPGRSRAGRRGRAGALGERRTRGASSARGSPRASSPGSSTTPLSGSLYAVLRTHYGREPVAAEERLQPVLADARGRRARSASPRARRSCAWSASPATPSGAVVEFARDLFRPDRVEFLVRRYPRRSPLTLRALTDRT